jgi:hypothetical protein
MTNNPPLGPEQLLGSMARLRRAGIIELVIHDDRTGEGTFRWTSSYLKLLLAGREGFSEPGFVVAWATGDPLAVRTWIEQEAALLPDQPASAMRTRRRRWQGCCGR